jgi:hypothetical protein
MLHASFKLPDDTANQIIQRTGDIDDNYWWLGDLTADLIDELKGLAKKSEIRREIAVYARISPETLRDQERMSRKIPPDKRIYELSRHQYRACLGSGDWEAIAIRAVESADEYNGHPAPVAVIRGWISGKPAPTWESKWERLVRLAEVLSEMPDIPDYVQVITLAICRTADHA